MRKDTRRVSQRDKNKRLRQAANFEGYFNLAQKIQNACKTGNPNKAFLAER